MNKLIFGLFAVVAVFSVGLGAEKALAWKDGDILDGDMYCNPPGLWYTIGHTPAGCGSIIGVNGVGDVNGDGTADIKASVGVSDVGTLPTSPFYFLKEWRRGLSMAFIFNAVKKAELELDILDEKAEETRKTEEKDPKNVEAILKALKNYQKNQARLEARFNNLKDSNNQNIEELLNKLTNRIAKHDELFSQIEARVRVSVGDVNGDGRAEIRFSASDEYFTRAQLVRENNAKAVGDAFERTDKGDIKQRAEAQIKLAETAVGEFEVKFKAWDQTSGATVVPYPLSAESLEPGIFDRWGNMVLIVENHLDKAKAAFAEGKYGEAYGLARSAEVLAQNGLRYIGIVTLLRKNEAMSAPKPESINSDAGNDTRNANPTPQPENPRPRSIEQAEPRVIRVSGSNFAFNTSEIRVKKGETVKIVLTNAGGWPHDWVVDEFNARTKVINAGESTEVVFTADKVGSFEYYCSVGNHRAMGMVGKLIVE